MMLAQEDLSLEYLPIAIFAFIAVGLALIIILIPFTLSRRRGYKVKEQAYECGFKSFHESNNKVISIRFYLVAILFIIFDLEVAFLFPWALVLNSIGTYGYISMMSFLFIVTLGLVYEWKKGALDY